MNPRLLPQSNFVPIPENDKCTAFSIALLRLLCYNAAIPIPGSLEQFLNLTALLVYAQPQHRGYKSGNLVF